MFGTVCVPVDNGLNNCNFAIFSSNMQRRFAISTARILEGNFVDNEFDNISVASFHCSMQEAVFVTS